MRRCKTTHHVSDVWHVLACGCGGHMRMTRTKNGRERFRVAYIPFELLLQLAASVSELLHLAVCRETGFVQLRATTATSTTMASDDTFQEPPRHVNDTGKNAEKDKVLYHTCLNHA